MDREAFYAWLRRRNSGVFGTSLSSRQVRGIEPILDEGAHLPLPELSNVLAQTYRETGGGMYPVKETVYSYSRDKNPSDDTVIARLDRAWVKGQLTWVSRPYWRDGAFGRGGIQLTHWDNYRKLSPHVGVDLRQNPDAALDPVISARIAVKGCEFGLFTGKKLSDYRGRDYDHFNARSIVNGDKNKRDTGGGPKVGMQIATAGRAFEDALDAAGYKPSSERSPEPTHPIPDHVPVYPPGKPAGGFWATIMALFSNFGSK